MKLPTLSIIIPNYNHGHCLPIAVNAILKQSVQPFEIIIIDDGSTDESVDVIEGLAGRYATIKFFRNNQNRGVCFTVNRGIEMARGEYVFLSSADDKILPGFLEKSLQVLARHPVAALSCTIGDWRELATGMNWHVGIGMAETPSYLSPARMVELERQGRFYIPTHTTILKRSALIEAGKLIPELQTTVDWFVIYVMGYRHGICVVPEPLAVLQISPDSYYKRVRRDARSYRAVLVCLLDLLNQPTYQDAAALIREGGSLYIFALPMLKVLLSRPADRRFITLNYLRKCLSHSNKLFLKRFTPAFLGNWYFRLAGYRARVPKPGPK